jgi:competence protein ComEA
MSAHDEAAPSRQGQAPARPPRPRPDRQHRGRIRGEGRLVGPLVAFLRGRAFVPACLFVGLVFVAGTGLELAVRFGWTPAGLLGAQRHTIVITGPGVDQPLATIQAYVLGAVAQPGVYALPPGSRVQDLVRAAGGMLPDADPARVDLAAPVADGQQIYVPRVGEVIPADSNGLVNLNTASADDLHAALGISLDIARRIVAYRAVHGPFTAVSQLLLVPISRSTYDRIKFLVTT